MSDLDEKLMGILNNIAKTFIDKGYGAGLSEGDISYPEFADYHDIKNAQELIKQAFKDAGWAPVTVHQYHDGSFPKGVNSRLMTGQQWYERFVKELPLPDASTDFAFGDGRDYRYWHYREEVMAAGKKAAGIV